MPPRLVASSVVGVSIVAGASKGPTTASVSDGTLCRSAENAGLQQGHNKVDEKYFNGDFQWFPSQDGSVEPASKRLGGTVLRVRLVGKRRGCSLPRNS